MTVQSSSNKQTANSRPHPYFRSCIKPPKCHPTQLARAQLGDTKGAVYLPLANSPPSPSGMLCPVSIFTSPARLSPTRQNSSPPASEARRGQYSSSGQHQTYLLNADHRTVVSPIERSSSMPISRQIFNESSSAVGSSDKSCGAIDPAAGMDNVLKPGEHSLFPLKRPESAFDTQTEEEKTVSDVSKSTDGASDDFSTIDPNSVLPETHLERHSTGLPNAAKVHFASSEEIRSTYRSRFLNPFTNDSTSSSRRHSDASDMSAYLRPNAFSGHRDTLARLYSISDMGSPTPDRVIATYHEIQSCSMTHNITPLFLSHRDTLTRLHFDQNRSRYVPTEIFNRILHYISFTDYRNLRLTSRHWRNALPEPKIPASGRLPPEVLQQIYQCLRPCDFDAARHTCRSWFLASLDRAVGCQMMKKAGCVTAFSADLEHCQALLRRRTTRGRQASKQGCELQDIDTCHLESEAGLDEEWLISKRLATECKLSSAWHGHGLRRVDGIACPRFAVSQVINFNKLAFPNEDNDVCVQKFTASDCGKFVLVVVGTDIFVYSLDAPDSVMQPCVRLVAGKEVFKVSMDTSSGRYSVAALLSGRIGMCWDIHDIFAQAETPYSFGEHLSLGLNTEVLASGSAFDSPIVPISLPVRQEEHSFVLGRGATEGDEVLFNTSIEPHEGSNFDVTAIPPYESHRRHWAFSPLHDRSANANLVSPIPIRTKPTNIYKNLGCADDGPRSVAICPQRQCVAFGCRTGIELHWTDALTGRDLNRWFPLAGPGDHLYFLPQRPGVDSAKKLRLVSSAADVSRRVTGRHNSVPSKLKFATSSRLHGRQQSMTRLFFGDLPFPSSFIGSGENQHSLETYDAEGILRTVDCDHYHAVPLSDGVHMLFTDPTTGLLCLGSDAPLGGPTKLIRKVSMIPPRSTDTEVGVLRCYAASRDLQWGVRVVAAYDDGSIVLFNVPSDSFERVRHIRSSADVWDEMAGVFGQSDLLMDALMNHPWDNPNGTRSTADTPVPSTPTSFRSLRINGTCVGCSDADIDHLQVDCNGGGLRIWVFQQNGLAKKLDVYTPRDHQTVHHIVGVDGLLQRVLPPADLPDSEVAPRATEETDTCADSIPDDPKRTIKFVGLDGACDHEAQCDSTQFEAGLELLESLSTQSHARSFDRSPSPDFRVNLFDNSAKLQVEVLTDWRNTILLSPYTLSLE